MNEHKLTVRAQMADAGAPAPDRFEIVFLLAGEANDWSFSPQVLEDSARLWEGCSVFVDHSAWGMRSVRDLGGVLSGVSFDAENNGLTATLKCTGPSAEIVQQAAAEMLAPGPHPDIGFSADVIFTADAHNHVTKIVQPLSVDLVIDPAFATRFIRQLNNRIVEEAQPSAGKESYMTDPIVTPKADDTAALLAAQQVELCKQLVNLKLSNAELPPAAEAEIRARFDGRSFAPGELDGAVRAWKEGLAAAAAPAEIHGPGRASQMFDSRDQVQAALDDLIGAPREKGAENLQAAPFSGIREAYIMGTGDRDFIGGFHGEHARFSLTAASFPGLLVNSLNKALARHWETLGRARYDWWQKIVTVEHFNTLNDITWVLFGSVGALPTVAENGEYTELKIGDSAETSSFVKRGGYIGLSLEAMDKDDTRMLRAIPRELAAAALRNISARVAEIFTSASGAGPTLADTGALFNATAQTTKGGHKNLLTTALGTDFTAWDAVAAAVYNQPMLVASEAGYYGSGAKWALEPRYCLVPRALKAQAEALFIPRWAAVIEQAAAKGGPSFAGTVEPITVPEWTDETDWAAVVDPALAPGIMIGERFGLLPQIFTAASETDPAMFSNDEARIKVRHFLAVGVADYRALHKSNVAG